MNKCAYCRTYPPAEGEEVPAHRDVRSCPRDGAVCGTCGARSAEPVLGGVGGVSNRLYGLLRSML